VPAVRTVLEQALDVVDHRFDRIEESMVFGRVPVKAVQSA